MECFDTLPLACVISNKFLVIHGGLSPQLTKLEQLNQINRFREPPENSLLIDILWSDPVDDSKVQDSPNFAFNENRGCSFTFGPQVTNNFLFTNKLVSIVRAHEAKLEGF